MEQTGGGSGSSSWSRRVKLVAGPRRGWTTGAQDGAEPRSTKGTPAKQQQAPGAFGDLLTMIKLRTQPLSGQELQTDAQGRALLETRPHAELQLPPISGPAPAAPGASSSVFGAQLLRAGSSGGGGAKHPAPAADSLPAASSKRAMVPALDPSMPATLGTSFGVQRKVPGAILRSGLQVPATSAPGQKDMLVDEEPGATADSQSLLRQYIDLQANQDASPPDEEEGQDAAVEGGLVDAHTSLLLHQAAKGVAAPLLPSAGGAAVAVRHMSPRPGPQGSVPYRTASGARPLRHSMSAPGALVARLSAGPSAATATAAPVQSALPSSCASRASPSLRAGAAQGGRAGTSSAVVPAPGAAPVPVVLTLRALLEAGLQHFAEAALPSQGWVPGASTLREKPPAGELVFDSDFEGGNLALVKKCPDSIEYELMLRADSNNPKYRLWFRFCVSNAHPGQQVVFTIMNLSKTKSLFRHGMTPVVRSTSRPQWCRVPARNTFYYKSAKSYLLSFAFVFDEPADTYEFAFSFPFTYTALQCELHFLERLGLPYCRRQLLARTLQLRKVDLLCIADPLPPCPLLATASAASPGLPAPPGGLVAACRRSAGSTAAAGLQPGSEGGAVAVSGGSAGDVHGRADVDVGGRGLPPAPPMQVDMNAGGKVAEAVASAGGTVGPAGSRAPPQRRVVCVTGRVHPGETPASFVVQGLMSYLLSSESEACNLRSNLTFLITPMLNPDGVFLGNYRTDSSGIDLNRMWMVGAATPGGSLPALHSQMELLLAYQASPDFQVELFIDVHAHSTSRASFMFCNRPAPSQAAGGAAGNNAAAVEAAQATQAALERVVRLPRLLEAMMPGFSLSACVFDDERTKAGCARRAVGALLPEALSYTLEISFFHSSPDTVVVAASGQPQVSITNTVEGYLEMGKQLALAIHELFKLGHPGGGAIHSAASVGPVSGNSSGAGAQPMAPGTSGPAPQPLELQGFAAPLST